MKIKPFLSLLLLALVGMPGYAKGAHQLPTRHSSSGQFTDKVNLIAVGQQGDQTTFVFGGKEDWQDKALAYVVSTKSNHFEMRKLVTNDLLVQSKYIATSSTGNVLIFATSTTLQIWERNKNNAYVVTQKIKSKEYFDDVQLSPDGRFFVLLHSGRRAAMIWHKWDDGRWRKEQEITACAVAIGMHKKKPVIVARVSKSNVLLWAEEDVDCLCETKFSWFNDKVVNLPGNYLAATTYGPLHIVSWDTKKVYCCQVQDQWKILMDIEQVKGLQGRSTIHKVVCCVDRFDKLHIDVSFKSAVCKGLVAQPLSKVGIIQGTKIYLPELHSPIIHLAGGSACLAAVFEDGSFGLHNFRDDTTTSVLKLIHNALRTDDYQTDTDSHTDSYTTWLRNKLSPTNVLLGLGAAACLYGGYYALHTLNSYANVYERLCNLF